MHYSFRHLLGAKQRSKAIQFFPFSSWRILWSSLIVVSLPLTDLSLFAQPRKQFTSSLSKRSHSCSTTMKTIVYGPNNQPQWKESSRPGKPPRRGQVLVQVQAVGLNPVDAKGVIGDKLPHSWTTLQSLAQRCIVQSKVIGFDFAGVVVESQPTTTTTTSGFTVGDRVYGILPPSRYGGTLQEYLVVPTEQVARIPDSLSFTQAAALPLVGITALQCLQGAGWPAAAAAAKDNDDSKTNKKLLVLGASGGTGHVAVQVGHALQPNAHMVAVCSSRNQEFVQNLLNHKETLTVLDYRNEQFTEQLLEHGPYDAVMDCVTSGDPRDQASLDYQKLIWETPGLTLPHTQYRRLGGAFVDWCKAGIERATGISTWRGNTKLFWIQMHQSAPILEQLAVWLQTGAMRGATVAQTVPFSPEGVQQGFEALMARHVVGKVVVDMTSGTGEEGKEAVASEQDKKES